MRGREFRRGNARSVRYSEKIRCRNRRCGAERHCLRTPQPQPADCHHVGVGTAANEGGRANSLPGRCQQPSRTWRRTDSLAQVMRMVLHRARRKTTSVIDTITRQARFACRYLSLRILTIQSCIFARKPITTAGATLIGARMCVHVTFHRICNEQGRWSAPLCKISF
jgi:hypothetical protein